MRWWWLTIALVMGCGGRSTQGVSPLTGGAAGDGTTPVIIHPPRGGGGTTAGGGSSGAQGGSTNGVGGGVDIVDDIQGVLDAWATAPELDIGDCGSGKPVERLVSAVTPDATAVDVGLSPARSSPDYIFYADSVSSPAHAEVVAVSKQSCESQTVDTAESAFAEVTTTSSEVYVTTWVGIEGPDNARHAIPDGTAEVVPELARWLAADSDRVFGLSKTSLGVDLIAAGPTSTTVTAGVLSLNDRGETIAVTDAALFVGAISGDGFYSEGAIVRIDRASGERTEVVRAPDFNAATVTVFGDWIYYCDGWAIDRFSTAGGPHIRFLQSDCDSSQPLVVDDSGIYWGRNAGSQLAHANLDGTSPRVVASLSLRSAKRAFIVDETHVYWLSAEGDLLRMLKP